MTPLLEGGTDGPYYDDLKIGDRFDTAPRVELTSGLAAVHHSIVGGRLALALDSRLAREVTGGPFANPALVWDVAIGQSTLVTQRAIANLFYRGLAFLRSPSIGDTLSTVTTIVGLRPVSPKPGRPPRGLAVMRIVTSDHEGRTVLDFHRCAMLPAKSEAGGGPQGEIEPPVPTMPSEALARAISHWDLSTLARVSPGPAFGDLLTGTTYGVAGGDLVSSAPELARLTLNLAAVHHDRTLVADGRRLVYGGHTIGLALAKVTRALPSLATVLAWHGCDHTGPVHENDTLHASVEIEKLEPLRQGGLAHLRVRVRASDEAGAASDVLDWRLIGLFP
ncbi:MAG: MaoC family dehydratase [Devosia sp.]